MLITIIVMIIAAPILLIIKYLFDTLLRLPTFNEINFEKGLYNDFIFMGINFSQLRESNNINRILPYNTNDNIGDNKDDNRYRNEELRHAEMIVTDLESPKRVNNRMKNIVNKTYVLDRVLLHPDTFDNALNNSEFLNKGFIHNNDNNELLFNLDDEYNDDIIVKILLKLEKDLLLYRTYILSNDIKSMSLPIDDLINRIDKNKIYPFKVNALITDKKITTMTSYDLLKLFDDAWGIRSVVDDEIIWQNKNKIKLNIEKSIKKAIDINNILKSSTDS